jgi:hypothetical protein
MNEQERAARFSAALDDMLRGEPTPPDLTDDDRALLALGAQLAQTDFSAESRVREATRVRLIYTRETRRGVLPVTIFQTRTFRQLAVAAAALLLVAAMFLTVPPLRTFAQDIINRISQIVFAHEETRSEIIEGQPAPTYEDAQPYQPPGILSIEEASRAAGFQALEPAYIPEGFTLRSRFGPPTAAGEEVVTDYTTSNAAEAEFLHLSQTRFDPNWSPAVWSIGDAQQHPISVRGTNGLFVDQAPIGTRRGTNGRFETFGVNILTWQENGLQFILQSATLDQDELLRVAESLR